VKQYAEMNSDSRELRVLDEDQTASFDTEYVRPEYYSLLTQRLNAAIDVRRFRFLDVGGGNGVFTDRILSSYKGSHGTLMDISDYLLARNTDHQRKTILKCNASEMNRILAPDSFEVVFLNWILHHYIGNSYRRSIQLQQELLRNAAQLLAPNGCLVVFENLYDGYGSGDTPGRLIYHIAGSRALVTLTKYLGANTGGVGVVFHSDTAWQRLFRASGLVVVVSERLDPWDVSFYKRFLLRIESVRCGLYIIKPKRASGTTR